MPRCVAMFEHDNEKYYMLWSTVVDAPITYGVKLSQFLDYMKEEYGNRGWEDLDKSLERAERQGCSFIGETLDDLLSCNRAGFNEMELTKDEIIEWYCIKQQEPPEGVGKLQDWRIEN